MTGMAETGRPPAGSFPSVAAMIGALVPREPVYCVFGERLRAGARRFARGFRGEVLYAVKVNPEPLVLRHLHAGGITRFDTASIPEVSLVRELLPDATCYFMAPVRMIGATEEAYRLGVRHFAVDHPDELTELTRVVATPAEVTLLMRVATPSVGAMFELSSKFGTTPEGAAELANRASAAGFPTGLTFHVGSQCMDPQAYRRALTLVKKTLAKLTAPIAALDVGGGFPAPYPGLAVPPLESFFDAIHGFVAELALPPGCALAAEPGRALVADGLSLVAQVVHRRARRLYLNDGIYGSLMEAKLPASAIHYPTTAYRLRDGAARTLEGGPSGDFTLYGPTCDAYDVLTHAYRLPEDIAAGDWIEFGLIGAYGTAMRTAFNGFYANTFVEIDEACPKAA